MSEQNNIPPVPPSVKAGSDAGAASEPGGDAELGDLSRAYRDTMVEQPPACIDDAIRAAARRAVRSRPHALRKSGIQRWSGPVAAAAVVVLSVSVGLLSVDEKPEMLPPPVRQVLQPRLAEPAEAPAAAREEISAAPATPRPAGVGHDGVTSEREGEPVRPALAGTVHRGLEKKEPTPAPTTAGEPARFAADPARPSGIKTEAPPSADIVDQGADARAVAPRTPAAADMIDQPPGARSVAPRTPPAADTMDQGASDRAVAPTAPPVNKSTETAKPLLRPPIPADAPTGAGTQRVIPKAEVRSLLRSPAGAATGDTAGEPEAWLRRIVALRRQGRTQEAEEELLRFKRHYPDYALPAELREIAR